MYKKAWSRATLLFCQSKPIAFLPFSLPSPSSMLKLPIVVIQKVCYHSNVTSHFSLLKSGILPVLGILRNWEMIQQFWSFRLRLKISSVDTTLGNELNCTQFIRCLYFEEKLFVVKENVWNTLLQEVHRSVCHFSNFFLFYGEILVFPYLKIVIKDVLLNRKHL